jgi:hypothetical protein
MNYLKASEEPKHPSARPVVKHRIEERFVQLTKCEEMVMWVVLRT